MCHYGSIDAAVSAQLASPVMEETLPATAPATHWVKEATVGDAEGPAWSTPVHTQAPA